MPQVRTLTVADGQLATSAATLVDGKDVNTGHCAALFTNTKAYDVIVTVTFSRAGGTARRLAKRTLGENESLRISHLPIHGGDLLIGVADYANAVDYLITTDSDRGPPSILTIAAEGGIRHDMTGLIQTVGVQEVTSAATLEQLIEETNLLLRRAVRGLEMIVGDTIAEDLVSV